MPPLKTAWFAGKYFMDSLDPSELEAVHCPSDSMPCTWEEVTDLAGFEPDLVVYGDMSLPPPFLGLERFPCLTAFICVDSHIHSWYPYYAQAFDLCTVSLKDHIPYFSSGRLTNERVLWLPPFAKDDDRPLPAQKDTDVLFVGNVDPAVSPVRAELLEQLSREIPGLEVTQGDYRTLFPRARLVLNIAERGDLNYRVFEALGCGACLVTPALGHGQDDLFEDGKDLFTYPLNDPAALAEVIRTLLPQEELCTQVAASGAAKVDAAHRARHRAEQFAGWVRGFNSEQLIAERAAMSTEIHESLLRLIYLHQAEALPDGLLRKKYLSAAVARPS